MNKLLVASALAAAILAAAASAPAPTFSLEVPDRMVTGPVRLAVQTTDPRVAAVSWTYGGKSRVTPPPFELRVDAGRLPLPKTVVALALDAAGRPLFRQEAILDPGERFVNVEILSPLHGQAVSGPVSVLVRPRVPAGDAVSSLTLEDGSGPMPFPAGDLPSLSLVVPDRTTALTAFLRTADGRTAERTILLNDLGFVSSESAHLVEQLVSVSREGEPVMGLTAHDFRITDDGGLCEVREVRLLKEARLFLGIAIDTSVSLLHTEALKRVTAGLFLGRALKERDLACLLRFDRRVVRVVPWTASRDSLRAALLSLSDDGEAGTRLHEGVLHALYQFQGAQGARALVLVTDGNAYEDPVAEPTALEYARLSAVPIYSLGLPWVTFRVRQVEETDAAGNTVKRMVREPQIHRANLPVLEKLAKASGGRAFEVRRAEDLPGIYAAIDHDIRTQYLVCYVANARRRTSFHRVTIEVEGADVRTAPGYYH